MYRSANDNILIIATEKDKNDLEKWEQKLEQIYFSMLESI
jgi:hypothetical protein